MRCGSGEDAKSSKILLRLDCKDFRSPDVVREGQLRGLLFPRQGEDAQAGDQPTT